MSILIAARLLRHHHQFVHNAVMESSSSSSPSLRTVKSIALVGRHDLFDLIRQAVSLNSALLCPSLHHRASFTCHTSRHSSRVTISHTPRLSVSLASPASFLLQPLYLISTPQLLLQVSHCKAISKEKYGVAPEVDVVYSGRNGDSAHGSDCSADDASSRSSVGSNSTISGGAQDSGSSIFYSDSGPAALVPCICVPSAVHYMLIELTKNAIRASVDYYGKHVQGLITTYWTLLSLLRFPRPNVRGVCVYTTLLRLPHAEYTGDRHLLTFLKT